jgi:hypothetical protein
VADTEAKLRGFSRENADVKSGARGKWIVLVLVAFAIQAAGLLWCTSERTAVSGGRPPHTCRERMEKSTS